MWKQIVNTEDAMCYEVNNKDLLIRLEARFEDNTWVIYKGISSTELPNYTEEYTAASRDEAEKMINLLKKDIVPTHKELISMIKRNKLKSSIDIKRAYKEDAVEKWYFTVNKDSVMNFIIVREYDGYELDIVLHQKFKRQEDDVVRAIIDSLNLDNESGISRNIYYFTDTKMNNDSKSAVGQFFDKLEVEFDYQE